jgi:hypothetical protein
MKVVDLQRLLGNFAPFVKAAGGSEKVATEFDRALRCLEPFKDKTLVEFNEFLVRADEFDRTGQLTPPSRNGNGRTRTPKAPPMTVDEAVTIFHDLHDHATDPAVTYPVIDAKLKPLEKMTVAQLKEVMVKLDMAVSTKKNMLEGLARRIKELKASHERTQFRLGETA